MVDNENHPPDQDKPDKKLKLDLSEAMPHGFDEDDEDDIIELKDEVSPSPKQPEIDHEPPADADDEIETSELPAVENIIDLDALEDDDSDSENVIRLSDDLAFEEEDEEADEILPIESEPVLKADGHNDVVEITEFDDLLSEDTGEMMTLSEISEVLDIEEEEEEEEEDEFLELIDVEEDDEDETEEIEEIIQFDGPGDDIEDTELKDLITDSLDDEIQINEDFEDEPVNTFGVESREEINLAEQTATEEDFDFSMDSSEISKKIDQLDTIFIDDTAEETELDDTELDEEEIETPDLEYDEGLAEIGKIETEDVEINDDDIETEDLAISDDDIETEDLAISDGDIEIEDFAISGGESIDVPLAVGGIAALDADPDKIEETIEQIIERKFSGKIESMITQIIEKAVTKEIDRLKRILLEDDRNADL